MEEQKSGVTWGPVATLAAAAIAIVALVLNWQARTEVKKDVVALSALQLRAAVLSSGPYREELDLFQRLTSGDQAVTGIITTLEGNQDSGMPNLATLDHQLEQAAASALVAEQSRPELGVFDTLTSRIAATAVVVGLQTGSNPLNSELGPVIAAAEKSLSEGSIDQSVAELDSLPPELGAHFDEWKAAAKSRMATEKALDELTTKLVRSAGPLK